ncbi:MAG: hypothetical protein A2W23_03325 [Planctomycetes bacterium RBG_16_43_13]|nr:MAG: hypothetical protein A2W23_03325 [Planctomycetes bacterium RBG_16_43_13]
MTNGDTFREEYKELGNNMRHYANMRFATLTVFIAITSGLVLFIFGRDNALSPNMKTFLKIIGGLITPAFLLMEERSVDYWHSFKRRAIELEKLWCFNQYTGAKSAKIFAATNATRLVYAVGIVFWLTALLKELIAPCIVELTRPCLIALKDKFFFALQLFVILLLLGTLICLLIKVIKHLK